MKRAVLSVMALVIVLICVGQNKSTSKKPATATKSATSTPITLKTALDSFSYAMGMSIGKFYKQQGVNSIKTNLMLKGMGDAMNEKTAKPLMDEMQANMCMQSYITDLKSQKASESKAAGQKYLDSVAKQPGVVKLPSGLQYKVLKASSDTAHPKITDTVKFHYMGMVANGAEFDNTFTRNEPITHPVNRLIAGWTEALQLMTPGSKWMLFIPSNLGYGDAGAGDVIPPGATLLFEVELLEIVGRK
jgi:FKBP-type peptidyl-prolyl cis-trans isomerase FklB